MTANELRKAGFKVRLVRWDGYHEHRVDMTIDEFASLFFTSPHNNSLRARPGGIYDPTPTKDD